MEGEDVVSFGSDSDLEDSKVGEPGSDGGLNNTVPDDIDERGGFLSWRGEGAGLEEGDLVFLAGDSGEWLGDCEGPREGIST